MRRTDEYSQCDLYTWLFFFATPLSVVKVKISLATKKAMILMNQSPIFSAAFPRGTRG